MSDQQASPELPWTKLEETWNALKRVEVDLLQRANDALAASAVAKHVQPKSSEEYYAQNARASALFEAAELLRDAMEGPH
jgi:hypothetical protein